MGKNEILTFRGVKENPFGPTEKKNTKKLVADYIELGREVKDRLRADQPEASVVLNTKGGVARILIFSDFHFGAEASDPKVYNEALAELNKPNTFCILDADIIEGIKQEYLGITTGAFFDYQEQITASRGMFLREIIRKQKVLAAVTRNNSHDDWANNKESLNVPAIMLEGLNLPNGCKIPLIFNGGTLNIKMGEDGWACDYFMRGFASQPDKSVIFSCYQVEGTVGSDLLNKQNNPNYQGARVVKLEGGSSHATGEGEIFGYFRRFNLTDLKTVVVVHGDNDSRKLMESGIKQTEFGERVTVKLPNIRERVDLV